MTNTMRMSELRPGKSGVVLSLAGEKTFVHRLLDLGLTEGSRVSCLFQSIWRDPAAYLICGTVIALRKTDCSDILVREDQPCAE